MHIHNNMNAFNMSKNNQYKLWFNYGNSLNSIESIAMTGCQKKGDFAVFF